MSRDRIDAWRQKLRQRRAELRAGKREKKRAQRLEDHRGRSEYDPVTKLELVTKEGLFWLHRFGQALIVAGVCYDSEVSERGAKAGHVALRLQRNIPGNPPRPGLWETFQVPIGAANNKDTRWVAKTILAPKEADIVTTEFFR